MNKQEFLNRITTLIDEHCSLIAGSLVKSAPIIKSYTEKHNELRALVDASRCQLKNKVVMYELLRKTSFTHLSDRCYMRDSNALYNALYRLKANLPHCLSK